MEDVKKVGGGINRIAKVRVKNMRFAKSLRYDLLRFYLVISSQ